MSIFNFVVVKIVLTIICKIIENYTFNILFLIIIINILLSIKLFHFLSIPSLDNNNNMIFKTQHSPIDLSSSFDCEDENEVSEYRHGPLLGKTQLRSLIVGPSGGGKTQLVICLLINKNGLRFDNIYLYSKTLNQPKYVFLKKVLEPLPIGFFTFNDSTDFIPLEQVKPRSIIIIDDLICADQTLMKEYFTQGRHWNLDIMYIIQSYAHIPKHTIREQANQLTLFKMDDLNLKHIYDDHLSCEMSFSKFKELCQNCWSSHKFGFFSFFKDLDINEGRFRRGLTDYIYWQSPEEPFSK